MSKRVYKFTSAKHAVSNLESQHLKISTIDELNDPFDLASVDTTDPRVKSLLAAHIEHFRENFGLLCFSRNWDNLLMWSHYGSSHTGLCLGFDLPDGPTDLDVHYQPNLLKIRTPADINFDLTNRLLRTKHESWGYEQEVRTFVGIKGEPRDANGLMWFDFGPSLELKEVIVGAQCDPAISTRVAQALKPYEDSVKCWWSGMRPDAFLLIKQNHAPEWRAEAV